MIDVFQKSDSKITKEDRQRLKELRKKLRMLWFPQMEDEIRSWRRKTGVNSSLGLIEFGRLSRSDKERFFSDAEIFIRIVENASSIWYKERFMDHDDSLNEAYFTLNMQLNASINEVKKQYHKLVLRSHPDRGGDPEEFIRIANAYRRICSVSAG